jgi:uncharacterized SAM-binding protein YcdF (DUF218 family)
MVVTLLILWIACLAVLVYTCRKRGLKITFVTGVVLLLALGYGVPTTYMLESLQSGSAFTHSDWKARNVILLLGGGAEKVSAERAEVQTFGYSRIVKAAALYRDCKASGNQCLLLVSGGDPLHLGISEAALYSAVLESIGVPHDDLMLESQSHNTWENAKFSAQLIATMPPSHVVLVSAATHLQRSALYAAHFGLKPDALVRSDYVNVASHSLPQAYNLLLFDLVMHERLGIWRFHVYNALGWNGDAVEVQLKTVY